MFETSSHNGFVHLGLFGEVTDIVLAAADRFDIWERRPDKVLHARFLRGVNHRLGLCDLISAARLPEIGNEENAIGTAQGGCQRFGAVHVCFDDLVSNAGMLAGIAGQGPDPELSTGSKGPNDAPPLVSSGAEDCDQFPGVG